IGRIILCMESHLKCRATLMKASLPLPVLCLYPRFRTVFELSDNVEPTPIKMQLRRQPTIMMNLGLLPEVDAKFFEQSQHIWWVRLLAENSEILALPTCTAVCSTLCTLLISISGRFNVKLAYPRSVTNDHRWFRRRFTTA